MLSFHEFYERYQNVFGKKRAQMAEAKYRRAHHVMSRFGLTIEPLKTAILDVMNRTTSDPRSVRDAFNSSEPSRDFKIFATGPLRALWFTNPTHEVFRRIELTLAEIKAAGQANLCLNFLPFSDEAKYGFMTMANDPETATKVRTALTMAGRPTSRRIIVIQSGTTTCQPGVYNIDTNTVEDAMLFEYGAKNQNAAEFEKMMRWITAYPEIDTIVDAGAHGYAVQPGKVATSPEDLLPAVDKTKEAVESALRFMLTLSGSGKHYVLPQRKLCELKTSPADYMHVLYPYSQILDWGGGQIQEPVLGIKSAFEQRTLIA